MTASYRSQWITAAAIALFGLASAAQPAFSQVGPKNLMSPTYRSSAVQVVVPHELTNREAKKLAATAESRADHMRLAEYYAARADKAEAQGAGYERAAATYRESPLPKNFMSPTTPGRYEFLAKGFREEAKSNRAIAASHERMALIASL